MEDSKPPSASEPQQENSADKGTESGTTKRDGVLHQAIAAIHDAEYTDDTRRSAAQQLAQHKQEQDRETFIDHRLSALKANDVHRMLRAIAADASRQKGIKSRLHPHAVQRRTSSFGARTSRELRLHELSGSAHGSSGDVQQLSSLLTECLSSSELNVATLRAVSAASAAGRLRGIGAFRAAAAALDVARGLMGEWQTNDAGESGQEGELTVQQQRIRFISRRAAAQRALGPSDKPEKARRKSSHEYARLLLATFEAEQTPERRPSHAFSGTASTAAPLALTTATPRDSVTAPSNEDNHGVLELPGRMNGSTIPSATAATEASEASKDPHSAVEPAALTQPQPLHKPPPAVSKRQIPLHGRSLCSLKPDNRFRVTIANIVSTTWFDNIVLVMILVSSILLAIDSPLLDPNSTLQDVSALLLLHCFVFHRLHFPTDDTSFAFPR